jgi:hypothetical protein
LIRRHSRAHLWGSQRSRSSSGQRRPPASSRSPRI